MGCRGDYIVRYGEWVEVYAEGSGDLLASFKVRSDMCRELFDRYLNHMHNVDQAYKLKKRRK
jgi:hypothetical protein